MLMKAVIRPTVKHAPSLDRPNNGYGRLDYSPLPTYPRPRLFVWCRSRSKRMPFAYRWYWELRPWRFELVSEIVSQPDVGG